MKRIVNLVLLLSLAACGVETAGTAATAAALKKQEADQAKKSMEQFQQKLDLANHQMQQSAEQAGEADK
ncbi:hypothetical protein AT959_00300 [Dechloromonas denitrificans]|uniref:Lipoprotein n=1 Tax=Dechloromonas denitrificans TaxID=281362 RepID=A0A133XP26_9RHOO|nr:hypothetical protein [Dechloromonas denitrificans]KXB32681.1 hypothetical protein AT959_00300 [Dechloromonas denitrificans]